MKHELNPNEELWSKGFKPRSRKYWCGRKMSVIIENDCIVEIIIETLNAIGQPINKVSVVLFDEKVNLFAPK